MEVVLSGELEFYEGFGFEVYMIECDSENVIVRNIFEDDRIDVIIGIKELYELMWDWWDYLIKYYNS